MFKFWSLLKFGSKLGSISRKLSTNNSNNLYPIRKIDLRICGQLYKELKLKHKLYRNSPNDGHNVNIEYADTYCEDRNNSKPVIVGLHGVPGSHKDFSQLIKYFDSKNYRVIVPNFPGFELTRETQSYWHSAEEKAQLVRDLLTSIGVKEVDALVCHSGGFFPGLY
jgi:pimeloyl-ACP methyl ester carboxylesterase